MTNEDLVRELLKNIQIMTSTFETNNLQVLNVGCKPYGEKDADLIVFVELASLKGSKIPTDVIVKINLYDSDGGLFLNCQERLYKVDFSGYDTITINCYDNGQTLIKAEKGRLFAVKDS